MHTGKVREIEKGRKNRGIQKKKKKRTNTHSIAHNRNENLTFPKVMETCDANRQKLPKMRVVIQPKMTVIWNFSLISERDSESEFKIQIKQFEK